MTKPAEVRTLDDWLEVGYERGYIVGEGFCLAHDGTPLTPAEILELDDEEEDVLDRCMPALRVRVE